MAEITLLTHDARWKGLGPTVKRAAEAALLSFNSPLEGESTRDLSAAVGGEALKDAPHGCAKGTSRSPSRGELEKISATLVLSNDAEVKILNRDYRKKDKATNVLSFPDGAMDGGMRQLGDVVLAYETIVGEAAAQGKTLKHHATHLTIHGILHLLGFDHEADDDAKRMESREIKILNTLGIANPYEAA